MLLTVVALTSAAPTRVPTVVLVAVAAVVVPVVGIVVHRPRPLLPWLAVAAMLGFWAAGMLDLVADPGAELAASALTQCGLVVAIGLIASIFVRRRRAAGAPRPQRTRAEAFGRRADQYVVGAVVALGVAQVVATAASLGDPTHTWAAVVAPVDVVLACLLLRFAASRHHLGASGALLIAAALSTALCDALGTMDGVRFVLPDDGLAVLWTAAALLYACAAVQPSMAVVFTPALLQHRRSESARLLGLAPLALIPGALYAIGGAGLGQRLPTWAYLSVAALVGVLAVLRGAQAVRSSERRATQDPLTSLANRRGLSQAFDALLAGSASGPGPVGRVCLMDLDHFKHVNDTFGHETGDRLLVAVGTRLRSAVGARGTVARSGGDEFVLLLTPGAPSPDELLHAVFREPFVLETPLARHPQAVTVSAGWTELHAASQLTESLADADVALYSVKTTGRAAVACFSQRMREDVLGRLSIAEDLRRLLAGGTDAGSLELRYQPLVALADGAVLGCEALVRWRHPERGLLAPDAFLGLAEEHGLAARIDEQVLIAALAQLATWDRASSRRLFMSVNLGRSSMLDPGLDDRVRSALAASGIDPTRLHLEITEHEELPSTAGVAPLSRLAAMGVHVSLDDFGVGYTSLEYVRRYPISTLKIDRSLVEELRHEETSDLLRGVVLMAGCLGITVLAEGIETAVQHERLLAHGVEQGQGYAFAPPLEHDRFAARAFTPTQRALAAF
ncbi:hypothetical protein DQ239_18710 [Blastococcus sp. TF02-09]|nr:hypothetical protein DQ239_18710 [Blastococcus sp. TF02-9]